jgi:hypothetical protein
VTTEERDDLRATAEDLIAEAEELKSIEERKLELDPSSPVVTELSEAAEKVARRIVKKAMVETDLVDQLSTSG